MIKIKLTTSVILLILILPGCLVRYGEGRLEHLCKSIKDLEKELTVIRNENEADNKKEISQIEVAKKSRNQ